MDPQKEVTITTDPEVDDVTSSSFTYVKQHYVPYILFIIVISGLILYQFPVATGHILFLDLAIIVFIYGIAYKKMLNIFMREFGLSIGFTYSDTGYADTCTGAFFSIGRDQRILNVLAGTSDGMPMRIFNYQYTVGSGKEQQTVSFTVMDTTVTANLPQIILAANGLLGTNTYLGVGTGEHLKLEGDFNKYFSLYVPKGYEIEAYQIFTPDVMADLIDKARGFNFEFNTNKIYILKSGFVSKRTDMQQMFDLCDLLLKLFAKNTRGI